MITRINSDDDYKTALAEIEGLIDAGAKAGTEQGDRLHVLSLLVEDYENKQTEQHVLDPVEAIKFRMEQMNLSPRDLVPLIGSRSKVSEVLSRKRPLTLSMVRALHKGLGIPAKSLINEGLLFDAQQQEVDWERFPLREMISRGWISHHGSISTRSMDLVQRFFAPLGSEWAPNALYKSTRYIRSARQMDNYSLAAWNARVCILALREEPPVKFNREAITIDFMRELSHFSVLDDGPIHAREYLLKLGISLIIEPHLPETYIDGASLLLTPHHAVIGLTLRHDRIDNFWFVLMHEIAHIAKHLNPENVAFFDDLDVDDPANEQEIEADHIAGEALIPHDEWIRSPASVLRTPEAVTHLANKLRIHPAIVAGRIRHHYKSFRVLNRIVGQGQVRRLFPEFRDVRDE